MSISRLLAATDSAVRAAFPDRADTIVRRVEGWIWFSFAPEAPVSRPKARRLPPGIARMLENIGIPELTICDACRRWDRAERVSILTGEGIPRAEYPPAVRENIAAVLCGTCAKILHDRLGPGPEDEAVLKDAVRALDPEDGAELERCWFAAAHRLPKSSRATCTACRGSGEPSVEIGESTICAVCLEHALGALAAAV